MNKFKAISATVFLVLGLMMFAAPANAVPPMPPQVVGYDDHQGQPIKDTHRASDEIYRSAVAGDCLIERKFYAPLWATFKMSAILLWVPAGNTRCNQLSVTNRTLDTWGKCVNRNDWGYDFGDDYNDKVIVITVKRSASCPNW